MRYYVLTVSAKGCEMKDLEFSCALYLKEYFQVGLFDLSKETPPVPMQFKNKLKVILGKLGGLNFYVVYTYDNIIFAQDNHYMFDKLLSRLNEYPILFVIDELKRSTILQLIERKIAHIVPFERSYIPELMLHQDKPPRENIKLFPSERLGILPTNIVARFIDGAIPRTFTTSDIQVDVSKASISRSIKELQNVGIIEAKKIGRAYQMKFLHSRQKIWEAREYILASLASEVYQVPKSSIEVPTVLAGESALSRYTLLSPPSIPCYAVVMNNDDRKNFAITSNTINNISKYLIKERRTGWKELLEEIELQVFPYAPMTMMVRNCEVISPLMLSLSGYKNKEPRIKTSFEELDDMIFDKLVRLDQQDFK
jgi:DNA-binding transcriptional ArsR family regulator